MPAPVPRPLEEIRRPWHEAYGSPWLGSWTVGPLTLGSLVRRALGAYRAEFLRVAVPAVCVFVPLAVLDAAVDHATDDWQRSEGGAPSLAVLALVLVSTSAGLFGVTFYAGLLEALVGFREFGRPERPVRQVLRTLPYARLILANIVVAVTVVTGLALLVVPGLVAYTLLAIVGPVINIEGLAVRAALRRSVRLIRPRFWLAFSAATVPLLFETWVEGGLHRIWEVGLLAGIGIHAVFAVVVGATVGLLEVTLAHELIARDAEATRTVARRAPEAAAHRGSSAT